MGLQECGVDDFLVKINVIHHQANHGKLIVANHCILVLKHHTEICEFISGTILRDSTIKMFANDKLWWQDR